MRIVLIRHADAGDPDPERYPDDRLRPLTPAGEREHQVIARALARMGLGVTHVLSSPLLRARRTADLTARALGGTGAIESVEALGDGFSVPALLAALARFPDEAVLLCVGHEPHLSRFASTLLHPEGPIRIGLAKSAAIGLECAGPPAPGAARLWFLLPPRELGRLLE